jgi:hypothetical protein
MLLGRYGSGRICTTWSACHVAACFRGSSARVGIQFGWILSGVDPANRLLVTSGECKEPDKDTGTGMGEGHSGNKWV